MAFDHVHGFVHLKHRSKAAAALFLVCQRLGLPTRWYIESGIAPHHPDCTDTEAVLEEN